MSYVRKKQSLPGKEAESWLQIEFLTFFKSRANLICIRDFLCSAWEEVVCLSRAFILSLHKRRFTGIKSNCGQFDAKRRWRSGNRQKAFSFLPSDSNSFPIRKGCFWDLEKVTQSYSFWTKLLMQIKLVNILGPEGTDQGWMSLDQGFALEGLSPVVHRMCTEMVCSPETHSETDAHVLFFFHILSCLWSYFIN